MAKHNPEISKNFAEAIAGCENMSEQELLEAINPTVYILEKDDSYGTSAKLKIFSLLTSLSNCAPKERARYAKKITSALK
jgi:hypothetical protein